jgi:hypothetical protein
VTPLELRRRAQELRRRAADLDLAAGELRRLASTLPRSLRTLRQTSRRAWRGPAADDLDARLSEGARRLRAAAETAGACAALLERRSRASLREAADLEQRAARDEAATAGMPG